jgi:hypothetical protein
MKGRAEQLFGLVDRTDGITSPRFDDERTVQSARRVVPLNKIASKSRSRYTAAAVAFLFITLAGGMLIHFGWDRRKLLPNPSSALDQASPLPIETAQGIEAESAPSQSRGGSLQDNELSMPLPANSESKSIKKKTERLFTPTFAPGKVNQLPTVDRSAPHWRRERSVERRERQRVERNRAQPVVDGIFRIEDIFEGSRKP